MEASPSGLHPALSEGRPSSLSVEGLFTGDTQAHAHTCTHASTHTNTYTRTPVHTHEHTHLRTHMNTHTCTHMYFQSETVSFIKSFWILNKCLNACNGDFHGILSAFFSRLVSGINQEATRLEKQTGSPDTVRAGSV